MFNISLFQEIDLPLSFPLDLDLMEYSPVTIRCCKNVTPINLTNECKLYCIAGMQGEYVLINGKYMPIYRYFI